MYSINHLNVRSAALVTADSENLRVEDNLPVF